MRENPDQELETLAICPPQVPLNCAAIDLQKKLLFECAPNSRSAWPLMPWITTDLLRGCNLAPINTACDGVISEVTMLVSARR